MNLVNHSLGQENTIANILKMSLVKRPFFSHLWYNAFNCIAAALIGVLSDIFYIAFCVDRCVYYKRFKE